MDEKRRQAGGLYCSANKVTHLFFETQSESKREEMMREGSAFLYRLIVRNLTESLQSQRERGGKTSQGGENEDQKKVGQSMVDVYVEEERYVEVDSAEVDHDVELMEAMEGVSYQMDVDGLNSEETKIERVCPPDYPG